MINLKFAKLTGAGNDFVAVDNRKNVVKDRKALAIDVCDRKMSVGADGLLLIERSSAADFKMRIFNSDGSEASMCGNGIRCIALYAYLKKICGKKTGIETLAGIKQVDILRSDYVNVNMGKPVDLRMDVRIPVKGKIYTGYFLNTGVPHVVIFNDSVNVKELGRQIRFHKVFAPKGTNVNFVKVLSKNKIKVRTYERGVEDETSACGTGSTASACISNIIKGVRFPVSVITTGGETLVIDTDCCNNLHMAGRVKLICEGTLN